MSERCAQCGYDLTGLELPHRCPECGRLADPQADRRAALDWYASPRALLLLGSMPASAALYLAEPQVVRRAGRRFVVWVLLPLAAYPLVMVLLGFVQVRETTTLAWVEHTPAGDVQRSALISRRVVWLVPLHATVLDSVADGGHAPPLPQIPADADIGPLAVRRTWRFAPQRISVGLLVQDLMALLIAVAGVVLAPAMIQCFGGLRPVSRDARQADAAIALGFLSAPAAAWFIAGYAAARIAATSPLSPIRGPWLPLAFLIVYLGYTAAVMRVVGLGVAAQRRTVGRAGRLLGALAAVAWLLALIGLVVMVAMVIAT